MNTYTDYLRHDIRLVILRLLADMPGYAAMMQFGGQKSEFPQLWGDIPARPYLPMDSNNNLQQHAEEAVLSHIFDHLKATVSD